MTSHLRDTWLGIEILGMNDVTLNVGEGVGCGDTKEEVKIRLRWGGRDKGDWWNGGSGGEERGIG